MGDFGPVFIAVVSTAGTILAAAFGARRLGKLGLGPDQLQVNATLRELADVATAKAKIWEERYNAEVTARKADQALAVSDKTLVVDRLRLTQHDLDDCVRQRDNLYSELRTRARRGHAE